MNINTLALQVALVEGKKVEVNIAQIKEVLKAMRTVLKPYGVDIYTIVRNAK